MNQYGFDFLLAILKENEKNIIYISKPHIEHFNFN